MKRMLIRLKLPASFLLVTLLASCGGGGGDSTTASATAVSATGAAAAAPASASAPSAAANVAPSGTPANLNDPANAIRLAAALTQTTWVAGTLTPSKWTGAQYKVATRTDAGTCGNVIYTNADGLASVGDKVEVNAVNCVSTNTIGTVALSRHIVSTLTVISNSQLPAQSAWTINESLSNSGITSWDIAVTGSLRSKGDSTTAASGVQVVNHSSDGGQHDVLQSLQTSAKGSQDGSAFDYVVNTSYTCSFPAAAKKAVGDTCGGSAATLKGSLSGGAADATLTQTTTGAATFDIVQAGQTVRVSKNLQSGDYTVTTANGLQVVIAASNFESISRY